MAAFLTWCISRLRARHRPIFRLCTASVLLVASNAFATPTVAEPQRAATVDQDVISRSGLSVLTHYARMEDPRLNAAIVLDELIEGRLLARHAMASFTTEALFPDQRVAFALDVSVDERLMALLRVTFREEWDAMFNAPSATALKHAIVPSTTVTTDALAAILGPPGRLRLNDELDADQHRRASQLIVLRYRLPGKATTALTLDELYRRQNVQGRINLHNLDVEFLTSQARQRLTALLAIDWAERRLGKSVIAELRRSLRDREYSRALREHYGIGADMHRGSPLISELQTAVNRSDIQAWYDAHREDFRYVARVKARHIRVNDESLADSIAAQVRADPSQFSEMARHYSIAPDRNSGGDLGWLARRTDADWFTELAFAQVPHQPGAAVREPVAALAQASWEIVLVEDQQIADFAPDDETVRYQASRAIAEQRAHNAYAALCDTLHKSAAIRKYALVSSAAEERP